MLQESLPLDRLRQELNANGPHQLYPPASDRTAWNRALEPQIQQRRQAWLRGQVDATSGSPWPELLASEYMSYARDGNRSRYEERYFARRARLAQLVMLECMEYQGRLLDGICDGIWLILGEPTWCVPAHARREDDDPLPYMGGVEVDLFCCDTGQLLTQILQLLGPELRAHSPSLVERLETAVDSRILQQLEPLGEAHIGWFNGCNNWTPWCASNVLFAALTLVRDPDRLATIVDTLNMTVDRFIDQYGDDGGCDEGPMYWGKAAGAMYDYFQRLEAALPGELAAFGHPKIKAMGEFACTAHLHDSWVLNFADAPAKGKPSPDLLYCFGKRIGSELMVDLALAALHDFRDDGELPLAFCPPGGIGTIQNALRRIHGVPTEWTPKPVSKALTAWLPDIQVAVLREHPDSARGLILGAKGGHNAESHNHNDLGNFLVLLDGQPGIIDLGTATYERKTFGPQRYELWYIRSAAHNAATINGVEQRNGHEFAARDVSLHDDGDCVIFSMELAGGYPLEAGLESYRRVFRFDRAASTITVTDLVHFHANLGRLEYSLYSSAPTTADGHRVTIATSPRPLLLTVAGCEGPEVEAVELTDGNLRRVWGDRVYRTDLWAEATDAPDLQVTFTFSAG